MIASSTVFEIAFLIPDSACGFSQSSSFIQRTSLPWLLARPQSDCAPIGLVGRKDDLPEPGALQHIGDLDAGEAVLQPRAEAIEGVGAHHVERFVAIPRERPAGG